MVANKSEYTNISELLNRYRENLQFLGQKPKYVDGFHKGEKYGSTRLEIMRKSSNDSWDNCEQS